jgi:membrane fusion protein (multidrug efflux system)
MSKPFIFLAVLAAAGLLSTARAATVEGITEPYHDVTLGLADPGIIQQQFFVEGDVAKKGEVILELGTKLAELEVARRKAIMEQDKTVYESTQELFDNTKSVSKQDLSKAQAEYEVAKADYAIAEQELADRRLVAPFDGHITLIQLHPGAACAPYQPLVRLVDISRCYFVGHVDGVAAASLRLDEPVSITVAGGQTVSGKICFISPVVDAASGLARIKALFDNTDGKIRPGLAATMAVE